MVWNAHVHYVVHLNVLQLFHPLVELESGGSTSQYVAQTVETRWLYVTVCGSDSRNQMALRQSMGLRQSVNSSRICGELQTETEHLYSINFCIIFRFVLDYKAIIYDMENVNKHFHDLHGGRRVEDQRD